MNRNRQDILDWSSVPPATSFLSNMATMSHQVNNIERASCRPTHKQSRFFRPQSFRKNILSSSIILMQICKLLEIQMMIPLHSAAPDTISGFLSARPPRLPQLDEDSEDKTHCQDRNERGCVEAWSRCGMISTPPAAFQSSQQFLSCPLAYTPITLQGNRSTPARATQAAPCWRQTLPEHQKALKTKSMPEGGNVCHVIKAAVEDAQPFCDPGHQSQPVMTKAEPADCVRITATTWVVRPNPQNPVGSLYVLPTGEYLYTWGVIGLSLHTSVHIVHETPDCCKQVLRKT